MDKEVPVRMETFHKHCLLRAGCLKGVYSARYLLV